MRWINSNNPKVIHSEVRELGENYFHASNVVSSRGLHRGRICVERPDESRKYWENRLNPFLDDGNDEKYLEEEFEYPLQSLQRKTWLLFEKPESSLAARVLAVVSVTIILLSVISFCLETVPGIQNSWLQKYNLTVEDVVGTALVPTMVVTSSSITRVVTMNINSDRFQSTDNDITSMLKMNYDVTSAAGDAKGENEKPCLMRSASSQSCIPHFTKNPFWVIETFCTVWFSIEVSWLHRDHVTRTLLLVVAGVGGQVVF